MRISDWSSDVCSADLMEAPPEGCRIVALARPNRTKELAAPGQADPFTLASFTIKETTDFVRRMLPKATQETLKAFHLRTFGNPRVQAYQLDTTDSHEEIVRGLGPGSQKIGRTHVRTPVTNAHRVRRFLLDKKHRQLFTQYTVQTYSQ